MAKDLVTLLEEKKSSLAAVMPRHMTPERMIKLALVAGSRNPDLFKCTPASVLMCLMTASQLGLEPGGPLAQCHLIPFNNRKTGKKECTFIVDYRGLIELARRSGKVSSIEAHPVYKHDDFDFEYGTNPHITHKPSFDSNPGPMLAVYGVASLTDGPTQFEVMNKNDVDGIMARSKAKDSGPWVTDYDRMACKTVIKRLCKYLPQSPEMAAAIEVDSRLGSGERGNISDLIDLGGVMDVVGDEPSPPQLAEPKRKSEINKDAAIEPKDPEAKISESQKNMLEALMSKCALSRDELKKILKVEHLKDLRMSEMNSALQLINDNTMRNPGEEG